MSYANVTEGKDLNLTCHVTGTPLPSVEWTKVDDPAAVLPRTSVLTLRSVTRPGNANQTVQYRCTANNGYGEPDSAEVTVQVLCEYIFVGFPGRTTLNVRVACASVRLVHA